MLIAALETGKPNDRHSPDARRPSGEPVTRRRLALAVLLALSACGTGSARLSIVVDGSGSTSPAAGTYVYELRTPVIVTAVPVAGAAFTGWTGAATGTANPVTLRVDGDLELTAHFSSAPGTFALDIAAVGDGTTSPAAGVHRYAAGSSVQVAAVPASGAAFTGWSGAAAGRTNPLTLSVDADLELTAHFSSAPGTFALEIAVVGDGTTSPAAGVHRCEAGSSVQVAAVPAIGATFTGWSGAATGRANPLTVRVDADQELTAHFSSAPVTFALEIAAEGNGTTSPAAGVHRYAAGSSVQVAAAPASGSTFTGWSGAATGTDNPATVVMDADKALTAHFSSSKPLAPIAVYVAGDSTVSNYDANHRPQAGWGQMLPELLTSRATVDNRAIGGRTSRRFIDEGRLDDILKVIKAGDHLLVQFGTNDSNKTATYSDGMPYFLAPEDFKTYIAQFVNGARDHQAIPVLVTPPPRRTCDVNNDSKPFGNGTGAYAAAMKEVGAKMNAAVVDLNQKTLDYLNSIGCAASAQVFLVVPAGMYSGAYANGASDGTHFQEYGARKLAGFVAEGARELGLPLAAYLK
jgi:uncharacterized repeat protein (TIGR02543 family)